MSLEVRAARLDQPLDKVLDADARTIHACAVPYDEWTELAPGIFERFTPGALTPAPLGVKLRLEHGETIGVVTALDQTETGLNITATISRTRAGEDAYTLARDGALSAMSIGFIPDPEHTTITEDGANTYISRSAAILQEVSLVTFPAYQSATINEVRNRKETPMTETTTRDSELEDMRASLSNLERSVTLLATDNTPEPAPIMAYRSAGEYLKALAAGDDTALRAFDAASDITTKETGTRPAWVDKTLALMDAKTPLTGLFQYSKTLPAEGMTIEYPVISANTIKVAQQAAQGDTLAKGRLEIGSGSGEVKTYGGYSLISRQAVERAPASYLATVHRAQAIQYATAIESATAALFAQTYSTQLGKTTISTSATLEALTAESLADILIDLVDYYDTHIIYPFEGLIVSTDVFKALAKLDEMPKALQFTGAPDDKMGTLTINRPTGTLAGLTVHRASGEKIPSGMLAGYSSQAIEILENGGAPLRLSDEDITNLTKVFSVYGYAAHMATAPEAIVPVKFGAKA